MTADPGLQEILQEFLNGDRGAFARLWRRVSPMVFRVFAGPLQGTPALGLSTAEELSLELMEKIFRKLPETRLRLGGGALLSYLHRAALNHKRDYLAKRKETPFSVVFDKAQGNAPDLPAPDGRSAPGDVLMDLEVKELYEVIAVIRDGLTPEENLLLDLRVNEKYSFERIAMELAGSPGQTERFKKQFYRLCQKIRKKLEEKYDIDEIRNL